LVKCPSCGSAEFYLIYKERDEARWDEEKEELIVTVKTIEEFGANKLRLIYDKILFQHCNTELSWELFENINWNFE